MLSVSGDHTAAVALICVCNTALLILLQPDCSLIGRVSDYHEL